MAGNLSADVENANIATEDLLLSNELKKLRGSWSSNKMAQEYLLIKRKS
jgi:hypothetical protein